MAIELTPQPAWQQLGVVLAAGAGRRFGRPKAPVLIDGERLVDRAVRVLRQGGCQRVLVVLGAWVGAVPDATVSVNPHWPSGMGSSLRWGLQYLLAESLTEPPSAHHHPQARRALITLVDLPGLTPAAVRRLCREPDDLVAASYAGQQGHPVLIAEQHWPALIAELSGDCGARQYLQRHGARLVPLDKLASGADLDHQPAATR